jgi:arylsulfatase A
MKRLLLLILSLFIVEGFSSSHAASAQPNIILIMADDFGYECVTANGGQSYRTPNLDQLAATGVRFEQCHVQPLCTPTRAQLMTGRYNVRNYLNFGMLVRTETTFAHLLKKAGQGEAAGAAKKLQTVLDQFKNARPAELDRQFEQQPPNEKKRRKNR